MAAAIAAVLVFLALSCFALALSQTRGKASVEQRLRELRRAQERQGLSSGSLPLRRQTSSIPALRDRLTNSAWAQASALELARAGINLRVSEYLLLRVLLALGGLIIPILVSGASPVGLIVGLAMAGAGFMVPALYVNMRKRKRLHALEAQLGEALTYIANAMRAGFALLQAVDSAARRLQPPLAEEFARLVADVNLGRTLEDALQDLNQRAGSRDLDMVVTAILIQRRTGGNLSEILDNVAETMRERDRVRGQIRVLTAQQRFSALVLSVWPVVVAAVFILVNPDMMSNLWSTTAGVALLIVAVFLQLLGFLTLRRIIAIDY
jgi:tight adherence protein B